MTYTKSYFAKILKEQIAYEKGYLTGSALIWSKAEQKAYIKGLKHALDVIINHQQYN